MRRRIDRYRRAPEGPDPHFGCILLSAQFFLPPDAWIEVPGGSAQVGKTYNTRDEVGAHLWARTQMALRARELLPPELAIAHESERFREALVCQRLGQGTFRVLVTDTFRRACAVTGEKALPTLEAAHIRPYADGGEHVIGNGLLLRSDVHRLFDRGYVPVHTGAVGRGEPQARDRAPQRRGVPRGSRSTMASRSNSSRTLASEAKGISARSASSLTPYGGAKSQMARTALPAARPRRERSARPRGSRSISAPEASMKRAS